MKSVLCWLATSSKENVPNVSPKEIFAYFGSDRLIIANIASPQSAANIRENENVCVSFIDVFVQKGFQLKGRASILQATESDYFEKLSTLKEMAGDKFRILNVIEVLITSVKPILAPSYKLFPETSEEDQIKGALKAYRVKDHLQSTGL